MRIDIQALGFPLTGPLLDHTRRRLRFALARASDRIKRVEVRLGDTNGPRGGADKFCRIQVFLEHAPFVLIEEVGADLYAAIGRATERAGRNVARRVDRLRENVRMTKTKRKPLRLPLGASSEMASN
jgi:hypothetical protein